jgi:arylsulfatase
MLVNANPKQPWELYDLEADGTQTRNLADQNRRLVADLAAKYADWEERCRKDSGTNKAP